MQTVASLAERLDMTAEQAVERLRYMLFEVEGVDTIISDEMCDILIDVNDNAKVADRIRTGKLKEQKSQEARKKKAAKVVEATKKPDASAEEIESAAPELVPDAAIEELESSENAGIIPDGEPRFDEAPALDASTPVCEVEPEGEPPSIEESITPPSPAEFEAGRSEDAIPLITESAPPPPVENIVSETSAPDTESAEDASKPEEGFAPEAPSLEQASEPAPPEPSDVPAIEAPQEIVPVSESSAQIENAAMETAAVEATPEPAPELSAEIFPSMDETFAEILPPEPKPEHLAEIVGSVVELTTPTTEVTEGGVLIIRAAQREQTLGILARAEQQAEEKRKAVKKPLKPMLAPDPDVVAEVKRRHEERQMRKAQAERRAAAPPPTAGAPAPAPAATTPSTTGAAAPAKAKAAAAPARGARGTEELADRDRPPSQKKAKLTSKANMRNELDTGDATEEVRAPAPVHRSSSATGKTARKRQKQAEKVRQEQDLRREAAAAVREYEAGGAHKKRRKRHVRDDEGAMADDAVKTEIFEVDGPLTVEQLAERLEISVTDIILSLMDQNIMATKNQSLSLEVMQVISEPYGVEIRSSIPEEAEVMRDIPDDPADLVPRAPVVTVMGHVDHGKTTLLDRVRKANVAEGEAGGITQHIAAYEASVSGGRVVFLDTPGHEAFTEMRARGARVTDVVVLVVAADDGVMPQTIEAIDHARAAEVPIVVAINKCDKADAQPDRIRQELTRFNLISEEWGGQTIMRNLSAKQGVGVDELMELLVLQSELLELKANPNKRAKGAIIESEISRGQGPVAWVLVQEGTLRVGDCFVSGSVSGRVRAIFSSRGESINEAGPSTPVVVTGFNEPPAAGDDFVAVNDDRTARAVAAQRAERQRQREGSGDRKVTLEDFHQMVLAGEKRELRVLVKADVQGSVDVLVSSLSKLGNQEVTINIVHSGVGGINESDILLASASNAVVIGFHVTANPRGQRLAEQDGVDVRTYKIIYEVIDDVRKALEGLLTPETKEVITGHVEIRQVFQSSTLGNIAGCFVVDGEITRGSHMRISRDGVIVHEGRLGSIRREKEDVRAVQTGFECGLKIDGFEDIKVNDMIETFRVDTIAKKLT